jgi:hypothetical protein
MKTFADLKIGDTVYIVSGLNLNPSKIIELSIGKIISTENSRTELEFSSIKEETKAKGRYSSETIFTTRFEAIDFLKENISATITEKLSEIHTLMKEINNLKNTLRKY